MNRIDYTKLAPGIWRTVKLLNDNGFQTADSGDGVSNAMMGCEWTSPMIVVMTTPDRMIADADRIHKLLVTVGVDWDRMGPGDQVDASYLPESPEVATILITGVLDAHWHPEGVRPVKRRWVDVVRAYRAGSPDLDIFRVAHKKGLLIQANEHGDVTLTYRDGTVFVPGDYPVSADHWPLYEWLMDDADVLK